MPRSTVLKQALGCDRAINMDGGASTTMWINGKGVVNQPRAKKQPAGGEIKACEDGRVGRELGI